MALQAVEEYIEGADETEDTHLSHINLDTAHILRRDYGVRVRTAKQAKMPNKNCYTPLNPSSILTEYLPLSRDVHVYVFSCFVLHGCRTSERRKEKEDNDHADAILSSRFNRQRSAIRKSDRERSPMNRESNMHGIWIIYFLQLPIAVRACSPLPDACMQSSCRDWDHGSRKIPGIFTIPWVAVDLAYVHGMHGRESCKNHSGREQEFPGLVAWCTVMYTLWYYIIIIVGDATRTTQ